MKLFNTLAIAAALLAGTAAQAQSIDEIVKKHCDAVGGVAAWKTVKSMKLTGSLNIGGQEIPMTIATVNGKAQRTDFEVMGTKNYEIVTKTAGWSFQPIQQQTKPQPMTADELKAKQEQLNLQDNLVDYAARGNKVQYIGKEDLEGSECHKLKVTRPDGTAMTDFIDPKTFQIIRTTMKVTVDGKEVEVLVNYGNYQKLPEGITIPMTIDAGQMTIAMKSVEVNKITDESIFKPSAN